MACKAMKIIQVVCVCVRACVRACVCACVCVFVHKPFFRQYFTFISSHLSLNCEVCWGTTDDLANSFLHFHCSPLAPWDLATSRPVHFLMLSSQLFLCLPCLFPSFSVPCKMVWPDLMNRRHDHTTAVCISL